MKKLALFLVPIALANGCGMIDEGFFSPIPVPAQVQEDVKKPDAQQVDEALKVFIRGTSDLKTRTLYSAYLHQLSPEAKIFLLADLYQRPASPQADWWQIPVGWAAEKVAEETVKYTAGKVKEAYEAVQQREAVRQQLEKQKRDNPPPPPPARMSRCRPGVCPE